MKYYAKNSLKTAALRARVNQIPTPNNLPLWRNFFIGIFLWLGSPYILFTTPWLWGHHPIIVALIICFFAAVFAIGFLFLGTTQHHASHGGFSKNQRVNRWMAKSIFFIGLWHKNWRMQHVVLHHTYTNLYEKDPDVRSAEAVNMIFSPFSEKKPYYKQARKWFVYFVYGLTFLSWQTFGDFRRVFEYHAIDRRLFNNDKSLPRSLVEISIFKLCYFSLTIVLPLVMGTPWYIVIPFWFVGLWIAGSLLMPIFQMAHINTWTKHFCAPNHLPATEGIDQYQHALVTTVDFYISNKFLNRIFTNVFGYLNYQVIHHLFPGINPMKYPKISKLLENWYPKIQYRKLPLRVAWRSHLDYLLRLTNEEFVSLARSRELTEM